MVRSENAGMSIRKAGENPSHRNPRVLSNDRRLRVSQDLSRGKDIGDGEQVEIPVQTVPSW